MVCSTAPLSFTTTRAPRVDDTKAHTPLTMRMHSRTHGDGSQHHTAHMRHTSHVHQLACIRIAVPSWCRPHRVELTPHHRCMLPSPHPPTALRCAHESAPRRLGSGMHTHTSHIISSHHLCCVCVVHSRWLASTHHSRTDSRTSPRPSHPLPFVLAGHTPHSLVWATSACCPTGALTTRTRGPV